MGNSRLNLVLIIIFFLSVLTFTVLYVYKIVKNTNSAEEMPETDVLDADDDKYWKAGIFYVNKEDPSVLVEKRFGVGWTLNFGNPKSCIYLLLPIVLVMIAAFII